ncbi:MAG: hypothetical protein ACO1RX_02565 [Candidatus Sericytochromatia bacterium]
MKSDSSVRGLTADPQGHLIFTAFEDHRIYRLQDREVTLLAGNGQAGYQDGPAAEAQFNHPRAIEIDANGTLYLLEADQHRIRKITPDGLVSTLAGGAQAGYQDGKGAEARFNQPYDLALTASGELLVSDTGNHRIRKVSPDGTVTTVIGNGQTGESEGGPLLETPISSPLGLDIGTDGTVYFVASERIYQARLK